MKKIMVLPMLIGAFAGIAVGLFTSDLVLWLGIGAGAGFILGLWISIRRDIKRKN